MMKEATYKLTNGETLTVEYDEKGPCRICKLPVGEASMGGTDVCPACDCGYHRDGTKWTRADAVRMMRGAEAADRYTCEKCGRQYEVITDKHGKRIFQLPPTTKGDNDDVK